MLDNVALSDTGALAAAVGRPPVTILGVDAYPTLNRRDLNYSVDEAEALMLAAVGDIDVPELAIWIREHLR